jgi:hypothetical protein
MCVLLHIHHIIDEFPSGAIDYHIVRAPRVADDWYPKSLSAIIRLKRDVGSLEVYPTVRVCVLCDCIECGSCNSSHFLFLPLSWSIGSVPPRPVISIAHPQENSIDKLHKKSPQIFDILFKFCAVCTKSSKGNLIFEFVNNLLILLFTKNSHFVNVNNL